MIQVDKKPFPIVCVKRYEFEGTVFNVGDIGYNSFGRNVPKNWQKATQTDIGNYRNRKR